MYCKLCLLHNDDISNSLFQILQVDFTKMQMTKPFFGKLRRTYSPGIWLHCRESTTLCYLQGYVHRIQVYE